MSGVPAGAAPAVPTTTASNGPTTSAPAATVQGTFVSGPDRIAAATRAMLLTGTTLPPGDDGLTRVRTASGEVALRLPDPLPADQAVSLQVSPGKPPKVSVAVTSPALSRAGADARTGGASATTDAATTSRTTSGADGVVSTVLVSTVLTPGMVLPALVLSASPMPRGAGETKGDATGTAGAGGERDEGDSDGDGAKGVERPRAGERTEAPHPSPRPAAPTRGGRTEGAPERIAAAPSGALGATTPPDTPVSTMKAAAADLRAAAPGIETKPKIETTPRPDGVSKAEVIARSEPKPASDAPAPLPTRPEAESRGDAPALPASPPGLSAPRSDGPPRETTKPSEEPVQDGKPRFKAETKPPIESEASPDNEAVRPKEDGDAPTRPPSRREPTLTKGAVVAVRVIETAPPADGELPVPPATTDGDEPMLSGTVAGATPDGRAVLATPTGNLALEIRPAPERGSRVVVALVDPVERSAARLPPSTDPDIDELTRLATSGRDWPALRALVATLAGFDPPAARGLVASIMPKPDKRLGSTLLFLLSAARGGDARGWLGEEAVDGLTRGGAAASLARFEREFAEGRRDTVDQNGADWRTLYLPMLDASGIREMRFHVHERSEEERNGNKGKKGERERRFLLDVDLTRLGPLQLDGLVRERRFDLILRSAAALADPLRNELIRTFALSVESVGFSGGLSFQVGARAFVVPRPRGTSGAGVTA